MALLRARKGIRKKRLEVNAMQQESGINRCS